MEKLISKIASQARYLIGTNDIPFADGDFIYLYNTVRLFSLKFGVIMAMDTIFAIRNNRALACKIGTLPLGDDLKSLFSSPGRGKIDHFFQIFC